MTYRNPNHRNGKLHRSSYNPYPFRSMPKISVSGWGESKSRKSTKQFLVRDPRQVLGQVIICSG